MSARLTRAGSAVRAARAAGTHRGARAALALLLLGAGGCFLPRGQALPRGAWVSGSSGRYELWATGLAWQRVPTGTLSDPDTDLELESRGRLAWIVARVNERRQSADELLDARRALIYGAYEVTRAEERREFLPGPEPLAVTFGEYHVGNNLFTRQFFAVAIADLGDRQLEIVGYNGDPEREVLGNAFVARTVRSLRLLDAPPAPAAAQEAPTAQPAAEQERSQ